MLAGVGHGRVEGGRDPVDLAQFDPLEPVGVGEGGRQDGALARGGLSRADAGGYPTSSSRMAMASSATAVATSSRSGKP